MKKTNQIGVTFQDAVDEAYTYGVPAVCIGDLEKDESVETDLIVCGRSPNEPKRPNQMPHRRRIVPSPRPPVKRCPTASRKACRWTGGLSEGPYGSSMMTTMSRQGPG